jgi:hypothetical protein
LVALFIPYIFALTGGKITFKDGKTVPFNVDAKFAAFIGPGSNPAAWELVLLKLMTHLGGEGPFAKVAKPAKVGVCVFVWSLHSRT